MRTESLTEVEYGTTVVMAAEPVMEKAGMVPLEVGKGATTEEEVGVATGATRELLEPYPVAADGVPVVWTTVPTLELEVVTRAGQSVTVSAQLVMVKTSVE